MGSHADWVAVTVEKMANGTQFTDVNDQRVHLYFQLLQVNIDCTCFMYKGKYVAVFSA